MKTKLSPSKLVGILSTAGLAAASVAPNTLHIPVPMRPWLFMFTIAWTLLLTSGVFS
ncbi:MAG: hypothetical protein H6634_10760 [Anaerolineales bacterium]|nr:hypothetical protein [Anaerolineales bacterium]MCB9111715.1 hypothetical protein [Anaerolineales bacterium]